MIKNLRCYRYLVGKLTGYRATAEKVIKKLRPSLPQVAEKARTDQLSLSAEGIQETSRTN